MAPVARELSRVGGVLEPLLSAQTLAGQLSELQQVVEAFADPPMTLIGSSWGALLGVIFTAGHTAWVGKLILVGSAPFEQKFAAGITQTRLGRLGAEDRARARSLMATLDDPFAQDKASAFSQLTSLLMKADAYDPITLDIEMIACQYEVNVGVWRDAERLRSSGGLVGLAAQLRCPVVVVHGDYDPHPLEGVCDPLRRCPAMLRVHRLARCGHLPWIERQAKARFFSILRSELT